MGLGHRESALAAWHCGTGDSTPSDCTVGSGRLLSDQADVFSEARPIDRRELPLLHGPMSQSHAMMQQYYQINQWFAPLGLKLRELHLTDRMTWFMTFDSGLRVIVDQRANPSQTPAFKRVGTTWITRCMASNCRD